jgi:uncharacterized protein YjbI with pentapeptide repeats
VDLFLSGLLVGAGASLLIIALVRFVVPQFTIRRFRGMLAGRTPKDFRANPVGPKSLRGKYLFDADLRGVDLTGAVLDKAMLEGAKFDDATMVRAHARHTHLAHAKLRSADLTEANLSFDRHYPDQAVSGNYAQFSRATLDDADLSRARFSYAQFDNASLQRADLSRATMIGASFQAADLRGADLRFADLSRGRLEEADLRGANLSFVDLSGANLKGARVDETTVWRGCRYNQRTRWFDGSRRRAPLAD